MSDNYLRRLATDITAEHAPELLTEEQKAMTAASPDPTDEEKAERALDALEGLADKWAADVRLIDMIENAVSPMRLDKNAPDDMREHFTGRMKDQISAIVRQAWTEGAVHEFTTLKASLDTSTAQLAARKAEIKLAYEELDKDSTTISASSRREAVLREALDKARVAFAEYTQLHLRKSPPDMVKGLRNKELADMCLAALSTTPATRSDERKTQMKMNDAQIKHMVDRFLGWKLPSNFSPDAGITFKAAFNEHTPFPMKHEPSGTNLFDATQADAMVRYLIDGMPEGPATRTLGRTPGSVEVCPRDRLPTPDCRNAVGAPLTFGCSHPSCPIRAAATEPVGHAVGCHYWVDGPCICGAAAAGEGT